MIALQEGKTELAERLIELGAAVAFKNKVYRFIFIGVVTCQCRKNWGVEFLGIAPLIYQKGI